MRKVRRSAADSVMCPGVAQAATDHFVPESVMLRARSVLIMRGLLPAPTDPGGVETSMSPRPNTDPQVPKAIILGT